ncbi:MAG TPA: C-terminal binding protein [Acidimicrobiales bacterium]|nr:C-terminal binding protein [Acidimicrobiales bacterium]
MSAFRVVITDPLVPDHEIEREIITAAGGELEAPGGDPTAVVEAARNADGLLNTYFPLPAEVINTLERCKVIARYGIGVDNVDLAAASAKGIAVTNVPDYCVEEVATHALGLIIDLVRRIVVANDLVRGGGWGVANLGPVRRLSVLTIGLVGYGKIARRLGELLAPVGCPVIIHDPYVREVAASQRLVELPELLATSDVVSLHCPLTPETRGMINASTIETMRDGAILLNVARGGLVVTSDVIAALSAGKLGGAGLDTFEREPPDLAGLAEARGANLIATPHAAFYSIQSTQESQRKAATQVVKAIAGEPLDYPVN